MLYTAHLKAIYTYQISFRRTAGAMKRNHPGLQCHCHSHNIVI